MPSTHRLALLLFLCILAYVSGGTVSMLLSVYLPDVVHDLLGANDDTTMSRVGPWLNAAYLAGMTVGGLALGVLSDRLGRVRVLVVSLGVCGLATLTASVATDWVLVALLRACAGVGVSGVLLTCAVLVSEQWSADNRAVVQGVLGVAFPIGIVLSGGLNVLFSDWRSAFGVGVAPLLLAVVVAFVVEEKRDYIPSFSDRGQWFAFLADPSHRRKVLVGSLVYGFDLVGLWAIFSWMPTWVGSLLTPEEAGKMRGVTMMLLGMGGMLGTGLSGLLVKHLGVRRTLLTNFAGTLAVCCVIFLTNQAFSQTILVETALLSLFFGISQGALTVYVTELFPTEVRASGTGFCFNIGRVFTTSAVFFVGALVAVLGGYANAMLVFSGAFVVAWAALFWGTQVERVEQI